MSTQKLYHLNNQEDLKCLQSHDKEPLSSEQIADVEGPPDNDPLIITELLKVKDVVRQNNLEIIDDREMLSGGSFGPLFKLKARDLTSNQEIFIVERTFTERKDIERRFCSIEVDTSWRKDSEPRYEIRNNQDNHKDRLIIDYLYNEAQALKELQKIKGIPKFYGAVYDDLNGSILEEYIDGSDLSMLFSRKDVSEVSIIEILEKVKKIYTQAAEAGFIHNDPSRCTIMVDKNNQPYMVDWYLYSRGNIKEEGPIRERYLQGLQELESLGKNWSSWRLVA